MGTLTIWLHEAKNLLSADLNGKSDPYVVLKVSSGACAKSKVVKRDLNPKWNERIDLEINNNHEELLLELMDWDAVGSDDPLGRVKIRLSKLPLDKVTEAWYHVSTKGEIFLGIKITGLLPLPIVFIPAPALNASGLYWSFPEGKALEYEMGPVLLFYGIDHSRSHYRVAVLVVTKSKGGRTPGLKIWNSDLANRTNSSEPPVKVALIKKMKPFRLWRYTFAIVQSNTAEQQVFYSLERQSNSPYVHSFYVPKRDQPPRLVYTSCNGFSNPEEKIKQMTTPVNAMWTRMAQQHSVEKYHLIMQGGDQVYADPVWNVNPVLAKFQKLPLSNQINTLYTQEMKTAVKQYYFKLYSSHWNQPEIQPVLAQIPMINMWDDHDIFDGWGSWSKELQSSPVYQGVYKQAKSHFAAFQLGINHLQLNDMPSLIPGSIAYSHAYVVGGVGIVALDMRGERTITQILSEHTYTTFQNWLRSLEDLKDFKHLIVMSGVPLVYNDLSFLESVLDILPGQQSIEDDLRDHWSAKSHKIERLKFIDSLLSFAIKKKTRVTVVSGDVHLGALGVLVDNSKHKHPTNATVINNLISSPIGNVLPPPLARNYLQTNAKKIENLGHGMKSQVVRFPDARVKRYLAARNYLTIRFDSQDGLHAFWACEGDDDLYKVYIHPYSESRGEDIPLDDSVIRKKGK
eukprot:TRINITY_DN2170_c0_g8_i1.p1 TRINITY_DN2170_c0_g8~~TRINITY_DN2170_c0_g8_i1.p1  ORF type:complete len:683 (-),score=156.15 TRINITY_DN2170_c0_g8_i1:95-2143(-)